MDSAADSSSCRDFKAQQMPSALLAGLEPRTMVTKNTHKLDMQNWRQASTPAFKTRFRSQASRRVSIVRWQTHAPAH